MKPLISDHFKSRLPSVIRQAQITFSKRKDKSKVKVVNVAIGNVSLPIHPKMFKCMSELGTNHFSDGVLKYTSSVGLKETRNAFINIISADIGFSAENLNCLITDGGSQAMEIMLLGVCGPSSKRKFLLLDPAYTNYIEIGKRLNIPIITSERLLKDDGTFEEFDLSSIEDYIKLEKPSALLVIPYDNPTGQLLKRNDLIKIASLCVKYNLWLVSDEAYRGLSFKKNSSSSSLWSLTENEVAGITGRRISIESSSKVWNACGLRIGALVTDNDDFHDKAVSEYTANLCANSIGQKIFGVLAKENEKDLKVWIENQRDYYKKIMTNLRSGLLKSIPGLIVSFPEASIYLIIDFRNITEKNFSAIDFVNFCAEKGKVYLDGDYYTLLMAPMERFYKNPSKGKTQLRLAMVESVELIQKIPKVLSLLFSSYLV
ncbi:MAG: pyridoxal phosphate-dependent aminotransferase [Candidatus Neomarinimicrobiota bacterium]